MKFLISSAHDFISALKLWRMAVFLGWEDIRQRYVRTVLGPLWLIMGAAAWIGITSFVMAALFGQDVKHTLPFVAAGSLIWTFIANILSEGCLLFLQASGIMQALHLPLLFHVLRFLVRHIIILLHYCVLLLIVFYFCDVSFSANTWLALPGITVLLINALCISCILGIINTRYRDIHQLIATSLVILPFVTPVFWEKSYLKKHEWIATYNPFYHAVELVRAPLLGHPADPASWICIGWITLLGLLAASYVLSRHKHKIIYWL